ncbi:hypothetical protein ACHAXS_014256 [Conticribra weissflogii]
MSQQAVNTNDDINNSDNDHYNNGNNNNNSNSADNENNEEQALGVPAIEQMDLPPPVVDPDDPLLIAQTLTYVTDDGSVLLSFTSAPFSFAFKLRFFLFEAIFVAILIVAVPVGAHGTVVSISIGNLIAVAWFWYNSVRCVDITSDGGLRFWIGNVEINVPFDKITSIHRLSGNCGICSPRLVPHRGLLTNPTDGVAILTSVPSTPFWAWPRSAGRPERSLGPLRCPRLKIVFSPAGGGLNFIREVENEMHGDDGMGEGRAGRGRGKIQPPAFDPVGGRNGVATQDFFDV